MKKLYLKELVDYIGEEIKDTFLLVDVHASENMSGAKWLNIRLVDKTGELTAKLWSEYFNEEYLDLVGKVVEVVGDVSIYNGNASLNVTSMVQVDEFQVADYTQSLDVERKEYYEDKIKTFIGQVKDESLKGLLELVFTHEKGLRALDLMGKLPGSLKFCYDFNGGLLVHTVEVCEIAKHTAEVYNKSRNSERNILANMDFVIAGALMHDIGKIKEYQPFPLIEKSTEGILTGHIAQGIKQITICNSNLKRIVKVPVIRDVSWLEHILLSSHGKRGYENPRTIEALLISSANYMSNSVDAYDTTFSTSEKNCFGKKESYVYSKYHSTKLYRSLEVEGEI